MKVCLGGGGPIGLWGLSEGLGAYVLDSRGMFGARTPVRHYLFLFQDTRR